MATCWAKQQGVLRGGCLLASARVAEFSNFGHLAIWRAGGSSKPVEFSLYRPRGGVGHKMVKQFCCLFFVPCLQRAPFRVNILCVCVCVCVFLCIDVYVHSAAFDSDPDWRAPDSKASHICTMLSHPSPNDSQCHFGSFQSPSMSLSSSTCPSVDASHKCSVADTSARNDCTQVDTSYDALSYEVIRTDAEPVSYVNDTVC